MVTSINLTRAKNGWTVNVETQTQKADDEVRYNFETYVANSAFEAIQLINKLTLPNEAE